jgi:hypothetical protein
VLQVFAVALLAIALVYVTVIAFQLVRDGIRLGFVWPHLLRTMSYPLFFAIPLSFLIGITLGLGRMANEQELSALRVQGLSHRQLAVPVAALAVALSALNHYLAGWVLPAVHYEQANLRDTILDQLEHLGSGSRRSILLPGNVSLWVRRYDGPRLEGLHLEIPRERADLLPGGVFPSGPSRPESGSGSRRPGALGGPAPSPPAEGGPAPAAGPEAARAAPGGEALRRRGQGGKITLLARESSLEVAPDRSRVVLLLTGVDILLPEEVSGPRGRDFFHQRLTIEKLRLPLSFSRRGESAKDMTNPELREWMAHTRERIQGLQEEAKLGGGGVREELKGELASLRRRAARVVLLERKGRLTHFFLGNMVVVTLFFPLVMAGQVLADRGVPASLSMALPNLVLAAAGVLLCRAMAAR